MINLESIRKMVTALNIFNLKQIYLISSIIQAYLKIRSLRISLMANALRGSYEGNYKAIQRLLKSVSQELLAEALLGLLDSNFDALIVDYTDIERKNARKTSYIGYLKDGMTRGVGFLTLSVPFKGRGLPIAAVEYSSQLIAHDMSSKNLLLYSLLEPLLPLIEGKVIIGDREFCSEQNFRFFIEHKIGFAIRLRVGAHPVIFTRRNGRKVNYSLKRNQCKTWMNVYYKNKVRVNLVGRWDSKYNSPLYVVTTSDPKKAIELYKLRMKIEEMFRDLKSKLGLEKIMTKTRENFIKLVMLALLTYALGLLVAESLRKYVLSKKEQKKYSGLYVLLQMHNKYKQRKLKSAIRKVIQYIRIMNMEIIDTRLIYRRAFS